MRNFIIPDMQEFLKQHDMIWELFPKTWLEGIPLANGEIGIVVWGDGNPMRLTIDHCGAWDTREQSIDLSQFNYATLKRIIGQGRFDEARKIFQYSVRFPHNPHPMRVQIGQIRLQFSQPVTSFSAHLSLWNAEVTGKMEFKKNLVKFNIFIPQSENIIVIRLTGPIDLLKEFAGFPPELRPEDEVRMRGWGYKPPRFNVFQGFKYYAITVPEKGDIVIMWTMEKIRENELLCLGTIVTYREGKEPCKIAAERLVSFSDSSSMRKLVQKHRDWWHAYWQKSWLTIPDPEIEALYYAEIYKLGCSSQPGKWVPALQGPWTVDPTCTIPENWSLPPWNGDYAVDLNVQLVYWPIYTANRLELGEPLYRMFWNLLSRFQQASLQFYGWEGAFTQCALSPEGTHRLGWYTVNFWPGNGPWIAHMFWLHFLYSKDKEFLRGRAYPFMREFFRTYCGLLEKGEDGFYHLPYTCSPEWGDDESEAWGSNSSVDLALIRWLGRALLKAVELLDIDEPLTDEWREKLSKLALLPRDEKTGLQIMKGVPLSHSHRHLSHLMAIHPLGLLTIGGEEEERKLIRKSLDWLITMGTGEWAGYSYPWASLIASRLGKGNMTWDFLHRYLRVHVSKNSFHIDGDLKRMGFNSINIDDSMTLEGGFAFASAVMEMLLQSWGGIIRVFPSIPENWKDVSFGHLRAEGAFLVSSEMRDGIVKWIEIASEVGGICRIRNPWENKKVEIAGMSDKFKVEGSDLVFNTEPGGVYHLKPKGAKLPKSLLQFKRSLHERNFFGVKKRYRYP